MNSSKFGITNLLMVDDLVKGIRCEDKLPARNPALRVLTQIKNSMSGRVVMYTLTDDVCDSESGQNVSRPVTVSGAFAHRS